MAQKNSKFMKKKMAQKNSKFMKKNHFYFIGRYKTTKVPKAIFTFNISFSNIFLTLLDMKRRVVCSKSTGMSNLGNSKRKKLSTQTIDILAKQFLKYLRFYKVKMITLIIKSSMHKFIWTFVNKLNYFGILIDRVIIARRIPHNGMRVRKKRRV